ncbi:hypothetical protein LAT59_02595 [Candidatus Gracilibacteria bacterium]|nr:hypothetical protein [Candidatus Gracilibacteria bacterium]
MYKLFLDAVSTCGRVVLLDDGVKISEDILSLSGNESSLLPSRVFSFLKENTITASELSHIYVVHGPGSFTGIRSICLFVNTLAYIYPQLTLTPLSFFDLFAHYPIIKQSSRRDVFVKKEKNATIDILSLQELQVYLQNIPECYGSFDVTSLEGVHTNLVQNYGVEEVISRLNNKSLKFIEPLYIKNPNIS